MVVMIYALIWLLTAAAAGILFLTGNFSGTTQIVYGFILSTLVFMGMTAVLPWWVDRRYSRFSKAYRAA